LKNGPGRAEWFCRHLRFRHQGRLGHRDRHFRRIEQTPLEEVHVYGDYKDLAYYYADVYVGVPPQKVTVITDTGSTLLAFPCSGCSSCGSHMDAPYDWTRSSTAARVKCTNCPGSCASGQCTYFVSYAEGSSIQGVYYEDIVFIGDDVTKTVQDGSNYGTRYKFGCHTRETSAWKSSVNQIVVVYAFVLCSDGDGVMADLFVTQSADGIMGLSQGMRLQVATCVSISAPCYVL
jgi:hypothetical protein